MSIKKGFVEIYNLLNANQDSKVEDIMDSLVELMESQQRDKNHYYEDDDLYVFCYYHKEWELTTQVEYGSKKSTATGLNSMCKVGTNQWTKQQRDYKQSRSELLEQVASGDLEIENLKDAMDMLETTKDEILHLIEHHHSEALLDDRQVEITEE